MGADASQGKHPDGGNKLIVIKLQHSPGQVQGYFDFMMAAAVAADKMQALSKSISDKCEIKRESEYDKKISLMKKAQNTILTFPI